eukprot:TRINITY_DN2638_c4_g1_i1.p1 TRINITY_DN2638_c4_g1~~TRINITY_DN2638_c4_g1_i1.p1  ORF type:complete len:358 (+),score=23.12 TRINITY_DN2638_c4_g1_i1:105-1076(+)
MLLLWWANATGLCVIWGILWIAIVLAVDKACYGRFVFTMYEFFKFNFVQGAGSLYGTHPFHWYFTQGLPVMMFTYVIPLYYGLRYMRTTENKIARILIACGFGNVIGLSFVGHKEFRFVLHVLGMLMPICGAGMSMLRKRTRILVVLGQVPLALYFGLIHQRGGIDTMNWLRLHAPENTSILFLTPCHATPFYAFMHPKNVHMTFLDCSPPGLDISTAKINGKGSILQFHDGHFQIDEADGRQLWINEENQFLCDPSSSLRSYFEGGFPQFVIIFENVLREVHDVLLDFQYKEEVKFFHSHLPVDDVYLGDIYVFKNKRQISV